MSSRGPILFCLLISLLSLLGARWGLASVPPTRISPTDPMDAAYRQKLSILSADVFQTGQGHSVKEDCEFAAAVIRTYSRPELGFVLESRCEYQPGLQDYLVRTDAVFDRSQVRPGKPFRKLTSRVLYRQEASARYAAKVLRELNLHECNVLIDPSRSGRLVALDTVALITASRAKRAERRRRR